LTSVTPLLGSTPSNSPVVIQPAGNAIGTNSPLGFILAGINNTRSRSNNFNGTFRHLGDILATPELTVASPYLDTKSLDQLHGGISDAMYERIPQQVMGLLRHDTEPRFTVYAYGQSLKPAERSLVQPSGLCTNYQVTSEVAIRGVVRIEGAPANPHAVVENYNFLPPD
jgi:hypothetical protein